MLLTVLYVLPILLVQMLILGEYYFVTVAMLLRFGHQTEVLDNRQFWILGILQIIQATHIRLLQQQQMAPHCVFLETVP